MHQLLYMYSAENRKCKLRKSKMTMQNNLLQITNYFKIKSSSVSNKNTVTKP